MPPKETSPYKLKHDISLKVLKQIDSPKGCLWLKWCKEDEKHEENCAILRTNISQGAEFFQI